MPAEFFAAAIGGADDGLEAIGTRRAKCGKSFEAAAIPYARTNRKPVAVDRSAGRRANRGDVSTPPKGFRGIDLIGTDVSMPSESAAAEFSEDTGNTARGEQEKNRQNCLRDRFDGPRRQEIIEEVVGPGAAAKPRRYRPERNSRAGRGTRRNRGRCGSADDGDGPVRRGIPHERGVREHDRRDVGNEPMPERKSGWITGIHLVAAAARTAAAFPPSPGCARGHELPHRLGDRQGIALVDRSGI